MVGANGSRGRDDYALWAFANQVIGFVQRVQIRVSSDAVFKMALLPCLSGTDWQDARLAGAG